MSLRVRFVAAAYVSAAWLLAGCGGGGAGVGPPVTSSPSPPAGSAGSVTFRLGMLNGAVKSAAVIFSTGPLVRAPLSAGCPASPSCTISVAAPAGSAYRVYIYTSADGSGTALAIATGDLAPGQRTVATVKFESVVDNYSLTLSPATLTEQMIANINVGVVAKDVTGATLTYPYLAKNGQQILLSVSVTESDGTTRQNLLGYAVGAAPPDLGTYLYSGVAPYPVKFTSNLIPVDSTGPPIAGYEPVVAKPAVRPPSNAVGYALAAGDTDLFSPGTATLARSYALQYGMAIFVRFDPAATVWVQNIQGTYPFVNADAYTLDGVTAQGAAAAPIAMPTGDSLLSFDAAGRLYLANPGTIAGQPSVVVYTVGANSKLALVRTLALPAAPCFAAADVTGRLYVATCNAASGVAEYAAVSNASNPVATNAQAAGPVTVDSAGNVFAMYGTALGEWTAGTFGPAAPARTLTGLPCPLSDVAVDPAGNVYALTGPSCSAGNNLYYYRAGATSPVLLQHFTTPFDANYSGQHSVATPLR